MIDGDKTLQSATTVRPRSPMFNVVRKFPTRLENSLLKMLPDSWFDHSAPNILWLD